MGLDYYSENTASHDWPDLLGLPFHLLSMSEWRWRWKALGL